MDVHTKGSGFHGLREKRAMRRIKKNKNIIGREKAYPYVFRARNVLLLLRLFACSQGHRIPIYTYIRIYLHTGRYKHYAGERGTQPYIHIQRTYAHTCMNNTYI